MKLSIGQQFKPFGTDSIGVITAVSGETIEFHYEHDRSRTFTGNAKFLQKWAKIMPKKESKR